MNRLFLAAFICCFSSLASAYSDSSNDYPKSREERIRDEIGSITGEDGLVFRPSKIRNKSTETTDSRFNKYLWQAAIKTLDYAPVTSLDTENGILITDWFTDKRDAATQLKVSIMLKDNVIATDSLEVIVQKKIKNKNRWIEANNSQELSVSLAEEILRKAREMYNEQKSFAKSKRKLP